MGGRKGQRGLRDSPAPGLALIAGPVALIVAFAALFNGDRVVGVILGIRTEVERFVQWGLLQRQEPVGGSRRVYYIPRAHRFWPIFAAASVAFGLLKSPPSLPTSKAAARRK